MATIWRWDLEFPANWQFPHWEAVKLFPIQVHQPVLRCRQCGELIKVIPSFVLRGTTLTLPVLAFIAFAYTYSDLTWRDLPQKFCRQDNLIAYSTLYKAVHSLGRILNIDAELRGLCKKYLPVARPIPTQPVANSNWSSLKAIYPHTMLREQGIRFLFRSPWPANSQLSDFFGRFVIALSRTFCQWNKPIPPLYKKGLSKQKEFLDTA